MPDNLSARLDHGASIWEKTLGLGDAEMIKEAAKDIRATLAGSGVSFDESAELPVSVTPTVIASEEARKVAREGGIVRRLLNRMLDGFVDEHRDRKFDGPFHRFFTPYYTWWDIIAAERRNDDHIQLMRYDMVRSEDGRYAFMEPNCGRPGGTIHCAKIRDAWLDTEIGRYFTRGGKIVESAIDDPHGFVLFLAGKAAAIDPENPNIAMLNYQGQYPNELPTIQRTHAQLVREGKIQDSELLLGDIREIECVDGKAYLRGTPIALIHNKFESLDLDPADPEIRGWLDAAKSEGTQFLNSLGAMYLGESKRTLAFLSDPDWNTHLELSAEERAAIRSVIPYTRLIEDLIRDAEVEDSLPGRARTAFVLKADSMTRGNGIFIGDNVAEDDWPEAVAFTRAHFGIVQAKCDLPSRAGLRVNAGGEVVEVTEFYGVDAFYLGDQYAGMVGRSHVNQLFNVGSGGSEAPVLVVGDDND